MPASNHVSTAKLLLIFLLIKILLITEVSSSCQCIGYYEPLIINVQASQLTASGSHNNANLQSWCSKSNKFGWHANYHGICNESLYGFWIEVDFLENKLLAGIVTWGRATKGVNWQAYDQFVTSFHLEFLVDKSSEWTNVTENGTTVMFTANTNRQDAILNTFSESLLARKVRLYPFKCSGRPTLRWDFIGCNKYSIPLVKQGFAPPGLALCGLEPRKCFRWSRIPIRVQWSGFRTRKNETRLSLHGRSIACDRRHVTVGMEKNCTQCAANEVHYDVCVIEGTNEDGRCPVLCRMKDSQVGEPINLMLMVNGNENTELCAIDSDASLTIGTPGRTLVHDWPSFLEKIRDVY
ncbi:hypothetical protein CAPTEDRAFT_216316 [Capitella teleta]|uniref:F5/8 type C domain-containing protein n=1 Tax=Capitella teleta TaxID=283909 RepID=R7VCS7_CAPTE|nr:hypothetical protein CAPTEDRAFT_216316 [Capitella teleta]|eukprot:ELU14106.1 hypothetical protein CAPTEDRAFT_216316 [Capitella teleta]